MLLALLALLFGCQAQSGRTPLTVFAAASLGDALRAVELAHEAAHPDVDVRLTLGGSQVLRLQIEQGAPADVFASANAAHLDALQRGGHSTAGAPFAVNRLALIVPVDNPAELTALHDLPLAARLVVGTASTPVGDYTERLLTNADAAWGGGFGAQVRQRIVSREGNVRMVRAKVALGEADAGIVYATDVAGSDPVLGVPIPDGLNVRAAYHVAPITGRAQRDQADRFIAHLQSESGQALLRRAGFSEVP